MNNKIEIKNGELELFVSSSIIINETKPTIFKLKDESEDYVEFIFVFKNTNDKKIGRGLNLINDTSLEVTFINFNDSLGTSGRDIWDMGVFKERELFFYYSIRNFNATELKQFDFSFYLGDEVNDG